MKTKILSLSLFLIVSFVTVNAQIYVDGTSGKVGVGTGFTETTPPAKDLQVNGVVKADTFVLSDGTPLTNNGFSPNQAGDIQTDKKMIINNDLQVVNQLKIGTNSLILSSDQGSTGIKNTIYSEDDNLLIQSIDNNAQNTIINGGSDNSGFTLINGGTNNTGNVGIGYDITEKNNIASKLDVKGNVNFTGTLLNNGEPVIINTYSASDGNLALNVPITASSTMQPLSGDPYLYKAENAVDPDMSSFWANSNITDPYLILNLKNEFIINEVQILVNNSIVGGADYKVETSLNNSTWSLAIENTGVPQQTNVVMSFSPVNAQFVKLTFHHSLGVTALVYNIIINGKEPIPDPAIWRKQRDASNAFTDNIIYDKGDVTIGKNLTLKGWDNDQNMWVPKTFKANWRGTILFSRLNIQENMVEGSGWARGLLSQNLKWDETIGKYSVLDPANNAYPDFSAIIYENIGDIGFFTRSQSVQLNNGKPLNLSATLSKDELNEFRRMTITKEGNVQIKNKLSIGTSCFKNDAAASLLVDGKIYSRGLQIDNPSVNWCDYVFNDNYNLMGLDSLSVYIKEKKHLPDIPTENEVKEDGVDILEMNALLLKKIEELTLYIIELNNKIEEQNKKIDLQ